MLPRALSLVLVLVRVRVLVRVWRVRYVVQSVIRLPKGRMTHLSVC